MKKVLIPLSLLLIVSLILLYILVPNNIEIAKTVYVRAVADVTYRHVSTETGWKRWWPGKISGHQMDNSKLSRFSDDEIQYTVNQQPLGPVQIRISHGESEFSSTLIVVTLKKDSTAVHWKCAIETGIIPFKKIKYYQHSKDIAASMHRVLDSLQSFLGQKDKLYDVIIERSRVVDTILVSIRVILNHYPTTSEVYHEVNKLKQYISGQGAKETNYPMLHILKSGSNRFETMVAIPVNKKLKDKGDIVYKRMVPGNILVATVKGGRYSIEAAFQEMETYIKDHELVPPAIPFESLATDRSKEQDTTKWITRIYFPIL